MAADICGPIGSPRPACSVCERCKAEVLLAEAAARESALREDISRYVARDTERLAEVEKLREALAPFAKVTPSSLFPEDGSEAEEYWLLCGTKEDSGISNGPDFTGADLARARAALAEGNSNG